MARKKIAKQEATPLEFSEYLDLVLMKKWIPPDRGGAFETPADRAEAWKTHKESIIKRRQDAGYDPKLIGAVIEYGA